MVKRSLEGFEATLGLHHTSTMDAVNNLGTVLMENGDLEGAELMLRRALNGRKSTLGPTHTNTLDTARSLGDLLKKKGDNQGADELHRGLHLLHAGLTAVEEPTCFDPKRWYLGSRNEESRNRQVQDQHKSRYKSSRFAC
eukprot:scaffold5687_cov31-Prasinocladus_malaysianus.AAC.1